MDEQKVKNMSNSIVMNIISWTLIIILICVVVWAKVSGMYIDKQVITVETCNGEPTEEGFKTMEELGWKLEPINKTTTQKPTVIP